MKRFGLVAALAVLTLGLTACDMEDDGTYCAAWQPIMVGKVMTTHCTYWVTPEGGEAQ